jgi:hypothetical protein
MHFIHALVDAALALRRRGIQPEDVESATLGVASKTVAAIGEPVELKRRPTTSYLAQFSGPSEGKLGQPAGDRADAIVAPIGELGRAVDVAALLRAARA